MRAQPRQPRRRAVRDWERAQVAITSILADWDPLRLIAEGASAGAYRPEANALEQFIRTGGSLHARDVRRVFIDVAGLKAEAIPMRVHWRAARRIRKAVRALP